MSNRITFRRLRVGSFNAAQHSATRNGVKIATIQELRSGQWFWYGDGVNTASNPGTLAEAKAAIIKHFTPTTSIP